MQEIFDIIIIIIVIVNLLTVGKEKVSHNLDKKLLTRSQKRGNIIYLYKIVNIIIFFILFKIYSKLHNLPCGKVK